MILLDRNPYICPFCKNEDTTEAISVSESGPDRIELWHCPECGGHWDAHYTMTCLGIMLDDPFRGVFTAKDVGEKGLLDLGFGIVEETKGMRVFENHEEELRVTFYKLSRTILFTDITGRVPIAVDNKLWEAAYNERAFAFNSVD